MSVVSITYQDKEFPEGTVGGKILLNISAPTVPLQTFELSDTTGESVSYTFLAGVTYTIASWRFAADGTTVLGDVITRTYVGTETLTVVIRVPASIEVV